MFPEVVKVKPNDYYTVYVYFSDGKIVCYDVKPLLEKNVFRKLKEKDIFMDTCIILNDTLAWDISGNRDENSCIDINPEILYELEAIDEMIAE